MLRVGEDLKPAAPADMRGAERLGCSEVPGVTGERAAAHLQPKPVPGVHAISGREQFDIHGKNTVLAGLHIGSGHGIRTEPSDAIDNVPRYALVVDVAQPDEDISVLYLGADEDARTDRPDEILVRIERFGRVGKNVGPGFDHGVVDLLTGRLQERTAR